MTIFKKDELVLDHVFDRKTNRHYLNGMLSVFHCHHYATLYTQLAMDAEETELLIDTSEDVFFDMLKNYFETHDVDSITKRIDFACEYYAALGLGKMNVSYAGDDSGQVEITASHLDQGWIKKWGKHDAPVNYVGAGYINAMFSAVFDKPKKSFMATEIQSIVKGAESSKFNVVGR